MGMTAGVSRGQQTKSVEGAVKPIPPRQLMRPIGMGNFLVKEVGEVYMSAHKLAQKD